jgi:chromosome segregation ATPase
MKKYGWYFSPDKGKESEGTEGSSAETENTESLMIPKERFDEVNARMKEFEKQLKAKEEALKKAQTERLEEKEEYKQLYEKATSELSEIKPIAEQIETYKETVARLLEAQVAEIPEELRGLIPDEMSDVSKLNWIAKNKALLMKPIAPDIGAGNRGSGASSKTRSLTPEEKQVAKMFGYSEEEYLKYANKDMPE